jgi:hypothetical protein
MLIYPGSTVIRRAIVIIVPVILHPLVDVAMHVVEAIGVGLFFPTGWAFLSELSENQAY